LIPKRTASRRVYAVLEYKSHRVMETGHEMLFRVWDKQMGQWLDDVHLSPNGNLLIVVNTTLQVLQNSTERYVLNKYTGVDDVNGTPVFEDDIIQFIDEEVISGVVRFVFPGYSLLTKDGFYAMASHEEYKVMGNIREQPQHWNASWFF
jgi:hypothetical protein